MNSRVIIGLVTVVVLATGAYFVLGNKSTDSQPNTTNSQKNEKTNKQTSSAPKLPAQTVGQRPNCSLYSLADVAKVWGVPMVDTDEDGTKVTQITGPQNYQYSCNYNETDSGKGLTLSIEYRVFEDEEAAKSSIGDTRNGAKFGDTVYFVQDEVKDIGDEAFFSLPAKMVNNPENVEEQLYARKANVVYLISATNLDGVDGTYRDKILQSYNLHLK